MSEYMDKDVFLSSLGLIGDETKYGNRDAEHQSRSYSRYMSYEIMDGVEDSIVEEELEPVRHGRWVNNIRGDYCKVCSECGFGIPSDAFAWIDCNRESEERESVIYLSDLGVNYCPNCGAKMDLEATDEA